MTDSTKVTEQSGFGQGTTVPTSLPTTQSYASVSCVDRPYGPRRRRIISARILNTKPTCRLFRIVFPGLF